MNLEGQQATAECSYLRIRSVGRSEVKITHHRASLAMQQTGAVCPPYDGLADPSSRKQASISLKPTSVSSPSSAVGPP